MTRSTTPWMTAILAALFAQSGSAQTERPRYWDERDATAIRALLADGFETSWNSHQPATAATPDKCASDAVFINTTGGWLKGCDDWAALIAPLHAPGGPFADHTRRHTVEELQFVRPDVAIAVVKTFDIKRAGVATSGEETRGLVVLSKENGHWKLAANQNTRIQGSPVGNQ
jgi:uncharacterized protein (TIGR02246 family)